MGKTMINAAVATVKIYATGGTQENPAKIRNERDLCAVRHYVEEHPSTFPRVANASAHWRNVVTFWRDICALHELENPEWADLDDVPTPQTLSIIDSFKTEEAESENCED